MITHSNVYIMHDIGPVEIIVFAMQNISTDRWGCFQTDVYNPCFSELYHMTVDGCLGIQGLNIFLLDDC